MKIVVLAGGLSPERNVSLSTGTGVCRALRKRGHKAVLVDMFLGLEHFDGKVEEVFDAPDGLCSNVVIEKTKFGPGVLEACKAADIVFLGLHGECGEDGRVQATFDLLGIPYTGAGYLSSGVAMDKAITKAVMERVGVRTAPWCDVTYTEADIPRLVEELEVPCAVKVVNGGSSLGLSLPDTKEELEKALHEMLRYGNHILVEKKLFGRELTVGVLGNEYLPAVEIIPQNDSAYFDYVAKYQDGGSLEVCPAPITEEEWRQMGEATLKLYHGLGLSAYARADFILDSEGKAWCLEINTLPGMTSASLLPKEAAAIGMSYEDLCEKIVEESLRVRREGK